MAATNNQKLKLLYILKFYKRIQMRTTLRMPRI